MVDRYFAFKFYAVCIVLAVLILIIIVVLLSALIHEISMRHKLRLLESMGYEKYLYSVPAFGNGATYGWKKQSGGLRILDYELRRMSYKKLKSTLKEG